MTLLIRGARLVDLAGSGSVGAPVDVLIEGESVVSVGPALGAPAGARVVAADGRFLLPGLWDGHVHLDQWSSTAARLDLSGCASAADAVALVAEAAARMPVGTRLVGRGFVDALWPDEPTIAALDAVTPDREVVLVSHDVHCVWPNSAARRRFGVPDAAGALLREEEAFTLQRALDAIPAAERDAAVADALHAAATRGVVGVVDLSMTWNPGEWLRRVTQGRPATRIRAGFYSEDLDRAVALGMPSGTPLAGSDGLVTLGPLKVITDGSLGTRSAWCVEPYPGVSGAHAHGIQNIPPALLRTLLDRARAAGLEAAVHAIGDQANTDVLDVFAATGARGSVEHAQLITEADLPRFAALALVASIQPEHALDDRDAADLHWPDRGSVAFPWAALHEAGAVLRLGSDAPVAPLDPWVAIAAAVSRTKDARAPWHPEQELPVAVALRSSTEGVDRVAADGAADLVLVDEDPLRSSAADLRRMSVALTLRAGEITHDAL